MTDLAGLIAEIARELEGFPADDLEVLREGGSSLAGDLDAAPELRRFGAVTSLLAEGAETGLADWDQARDWALAIVEMRS